VEEILSEAAGEKLEAGFVASSQSRKDGKEAKKTAKNSSSSQKRASLGRESTKAAKASLGKNGAHETGINPNYRFETFVIGASNEFAASAAIAVARKPGRSYNPLFIFGGTGLGKTHLLHAIGNAALKKRGDYRVVYTTSEKFTNEFIEAIRNSRLERFRSKYRRADILMVDDIEFLENKERIQEEFFHTFNTLYQGHRQIVLTCDRPLQALNGMAERLISRFEWGLLTDLHEPDVEMRIAILKKKQEEYGLSLPDPVLQLIAERIRSNIRRLEGALARLAAYQDLTKRRVESPQAAERVLTDIFQRERRFPITIEAIQRRVAARYDLRLADMSSRRRPEHIAFPRQVAMFLSRELTSHSLAKIGEAFGGRDHGTVLHACKQVMARMDVNEEFRREVEELRRDLERGWDQ
ncbi:MAG: chromosomal replication initiator protein DnaA, partial [Verrucomicrobia bacterium]|nr:chromosomal replication initiator protein DnaA [Verrucomicrobiota bacterium]